MGFRYFVMGEAQSLEVYGYVRNLLDGGVEVYVEGEEQPVETLLQRVREGPRWSRVTQVQVEALVPTGKYSRFQVTG